VITAAPGSARIAAMTVIGRLRPGMHAGEARIRLLPVPPESLSGRAAMPDPPDAALQT
jgi:hypothetical protein